MDAKLIWRLIFFDRNEPFDSLETHIYERGERVELKELTEKAKKGDKDALLSLVMNEKDSYYRLALTYMRNQQDAQDMLQDMIVALYQNISRLRELEKFYSWSKTILVNLCKKELTRRSRSSGTGFDELVESVDDTKKIADRLDIEVFVSQLSLKHQEVIRLRYYMDMEYSEIAELLQVPLGTVKSRINSAMTQLKALMEGVSFNE